MYGWIYLQKPVMAMTNVRTACTRNILKSWVKYCTMNISLAMFNVESTTFYKYISSNDIGSGGAYSRQEY